jgi:NADP-dependent 3-hydroxy acid dehydrogenase YdfG
LTATEVFLNQLREGGGDLVNISSVAGRIARPGNAVYAATKWGMGGWSESLRQELQPDVTAQDVAEVIAFALAQPKSVSLNEILIRPTGQAL